MKQKTIKLYADTSVFGGPFDEEFAEASRLFFDQVRRGRFQLVVSAVVLAEIAPAPKGSRELFDEMLAYAEIVDPSEEALRLRQAYIDEGILPPASADDALYVALATVSECSAAASRTSAGSSVPDPASRTASLPAASVALDVLSLHGTYDTSSG